MFFKQLKKRPVARLTKLGLWAVRHYKLVIGLWLVAFFSSFFIYTSVIDRESFPTIALPINIVTVNYLVDDSQQVDQKVSLPLSQSLVAIESVDLVQATASNNQSVVVVIFKSGTNIDVGQQLIEAKIKADKPLPEGAQFEVSSIDIAGYLGQYDLLLGLYEANDKSPVGQLQVTADQVAVELAKFDQFELVETVPLIITGHQDGQTISRQVSFNQIGLTQDNGQLKSFRTVFLGVKRNPDLNILQLSDFVDRVIDRTTIKSKNQVDYRLTKVADGAWIINDQINSLQSNLVFGLVAIVVISLLLLTWRSAIITVLFMITVILLSIGVLYFLGVSLNLVTLFSLVLALGLFVDDSIIIVESFESQLLVKRGTKKFDSVVAAGLGRVISASWAGTLTTVLVFVPLMFIAGVLGDVIRYLPITIIVALLISFLLSVTLIPALARVVMFNRPRGKQFNKFNPVAKLMPQLAHWVGILPRLMLTKKRALAKKLLLVTLIFGSLFIAGSLSLSSQLGFNIFPPSDDTTNFYYSINYKGRWDLKDAQKVAAEAQQLALSTLTANNVERIVYDQLLPDNRQLLATVYLTPRQERQQTSSQLIDQLDQVFDQQLESKFNLEVGLIANNPGPQGSDYPLSLILTTTDLTQARQLATELTDYLTDKKFTQSGQPGLQVIDVQPPAPAEVINRRNGKLSLTLAIKFDQSPPTSGQLIAVQDTINADFSSDKLTEKGFNETNLEVDLGQESDNVEAFDSLGIIYVLALVSIYILLVSQFRSFIQPLLMLVAIPFTLPGVIIYLYSTQTPLSFFVMLGFVGLAGIAVNNTILLTDYANWEKRSGKSPSAAIAQAIKDRWRPLVTTTLTTLFALLPLLLDDPFWRALAGTIVTGLTSSTLMVIIVFPAIYLLTGYLSWRVGQLLAKKRK